MKLIDNRIVIQSTALDKTSDYIVEEVIDLLELRKQPFLFQVFTVPYASLTERIIRGELERLRN